MDEQPLVSVIMNCFNGEKYLREAIDSVKAQTYQNWELIFWDNQSTDQSAKIVQSYDDPRIYYFYAPNHTLLYEARNYAIEQSNGDLIAFLDVDDWWEPKKIDLQVPKFEDNKVGLVCGNFKIINQKKRWIRISWHGYKPSGYIHNQLLKDYHIGLLTIIISKSAYEETGGFNSRYHIIGDYDISLRIAETFKIKTINDVVANFRAHGLNETINKKKLHIEELKKWFYEANIRLPMESKYSLKNLKNFIYFLEGQYAFEEKNLLLFFKNILILFPSFFCLKLFIKTCLPVFILDILYKARVKSFETSY